MRELNPMLEPARNCRNRHLVDLCRHVLVMIVVGSCLTSAVFAQELPASVTPTAEIEARIAQVNGDASLNDTEKAQIVELLQTAITRSRAAEEAANQAQRFAEALTKAPLEQAAIEAQTSSFAPTEISSDLSAAPLAELETLLSQEEAKLVAYRTRSKQINDETKTEKSVDIQAELDDAHQQAPPETPAAGVSEERRIALDILAAATRYLQQTRIGMLEQRLLSRNARLSLADAEQKLLSKQIADAETRIVELRALVAENRQTDATRTAAQARQALIALGDAPSALRELGLENVQRATELQKLIAKHDAIIREMASARREAQRLEQKYASLTEQLEIAQLESSPEFGAALRKQRDQLASVVSARRALRKHEQALNQSRLEQFQIDALLEPEAQPDAAGIIAKLRLDPAASLTPEQEAAVHNLIDQRSMILEKLSVAYSNYIDDLAEITRLRRTSIAHSSDYAALLDQHLLWMPSANAMSMRTLGALGTSLVWLLNPQAWTDLIDTAVERVQRFPVLAGCIGIILFVLLIRRRRLIELLSAMNTRIGSVRQDRISLTLVALLTTILLALPGPLAMLALGGLVNVPDTFATALAHALIYGAAAYLILEFVLQSVRTNGLAELHFTWDAVTVNALKRNLPWFMAIFMPAIVLNLFIEAHGTPVIRDSLGRVAFVAATLVTATFAYRVLDPQRGILRSRTPGLSAASDWEIRYVAFPLIVLLPLLVAGLSIYGYHYTAVQFDVHLLNSVLVVAAGILFFSLARRALAINERRLAFEQVRARRAAALAQSQDREAAAPASENILTESDLQEIDLRTISEQTMDLLKMAVVVIIALALWNVWSGLLPAFKPLQNIELWGVVELIDGAPITAAVTLWDLLLALAVGVITFSAARNIPSLLEMAVLSRLSLETGTSYAVSTLARYLIVITGVIVVLQLLGAQWSKLQWLIAALSVGLGFGLQEIVANFVSGIVILFERPIRIGDTVTVGDQWGTVSRIRIRATTIVDWDRREMIIPNKTFIAERLINWTLTDPITRTTIHVGVAYGSDVALVETLLLDIARANAKVLDDPPPAALFMSFGDSSLEFQLRVYVRGVRDLIPVTHELNVAIDGEFRANGVEIAFPQRDVHFDPRPIEVRLVEPDDEN